MDKTASREPLDSDAWQVRLLVASILAGTMIGGAIGYYFSISAASWTAKDTLDQVLNFVGVLLGAGLGAYVGDRFARQQQQERDAIVAQEHKRSEKADAAAALDDVRRVIGRGLVANLITLETMVQEYARSGRPLVGGMYVGHFNIDHLTVARALGHEGYRDFLFVAAVIEACNARHEANHSQEDFFRMEMLHIAHKPLDLWNANDYEALRVQMADYKEHFEKFAKKLEGPLRGLLAHVAPELISEAEEGIQRVRSNVATGRDLFSHDDPPPSP